MNMTTSVLKATGVRTFRSLRERNYRLFFAGHAVLVVGTWMQRVAQDWLVLQLSDSGVALGFTLALQFAPMLVFGMWGGVLVDRFDRRKLIVGTQSAQAVLAATLGALALVGVVELWMVYVLALLLGFVTVVDVPARQAFIGDMVGPADYVNAQSLNSTVHNAGRLLGPALAGVLIASVGVAAAFCPMRCRLVPYSSTCFGWTPAVGLTVRPVRAADTRVRHCTTYGRIPNYGPPCSLCSLWRCIRQARSSRYAITVAVGTSCAATTTPWLISRHALRFPGCRRLSC